MNNLEAQKPGLRSLGAWRRKDIRLSQEEWVKTDYLQPENKLLLMAQPAIDGVDLIAWATNNRELIETLLLEPGAILFRNFDVRAVTEFERFIEAISGKLLDYSYRSTPRRQVSGKIYTSTEYPAHQLIPLHNENAYSRSWPMKIWFFCVQAAEGGGETPIADSRKVYQRVDPEIKDRFVQKKLMYVRNYGSGLDLSWQNVFQTTNKSGVEEYCRAVGMGFEWMDGDRLRTRQLCQAVARHPRTGEMVWFNQAHLFHVSRLTAEVRGSLLSAFEEEDLPRNVYYGDGSPIEASALDEICKAYEQEAVTFPWQEGDILMLDNMLTAHRRRPFVGQRNVVVGMAEPSGNKIDSAG